MMKSEEKITKMMRKNAQIAPKHRENDVSRSKTCFETVLKRKITKKNTKNTKQCTLRSGHSVEMDVLRL